MWLNVRTLWDEMPLFQHLTLFFLTGALVLIAKVL